MGEQGGKASITAWNWLWGIEEDVAEPETAEDADEAEIALDEDVSILDEDAIAAAEASLKAMQQSVQQLATATNQQYATFQRAKQMYLRKVKNLEWAEKSALRAEKEGRHSDAETAMAHVIQLEQLLPELEIQVEQAEKWVNASLVKLQQEQERLESYKRDFQTLKNLTEVNEALTAIAATHNAQDMASARAQFEAAKNLVHTRYLENQAYVELAVNPADTLDASIDMAQQQEIARRRLQELKQRQQSLN